MRVDRIAEQYRAALSGQGKENVYNTILNEYSVTDISVADFAVLLESNWNVRYTPAKVGHSQLMQKAENSRVLREKIADRAANVICTERFGLREYPNLALLLDYSGTPEAFAKNENDCKTLLQGSGEDKTKLFWDRMNPLLGLKKSVLEAKTDEELAQNWDKWEPYLTQFTVLDKILEEAASIGVEINPTVAGRMKGLQQESVLSIQMLTCRAGMVANAYYSKLNEQDIQKLDRAVLEKISQRAPSTLKDYLADNLDIMKYSTQHIKKQLVERVQQIGYNDPREAVLGNIRGKTFELDEAVDVLKSNKPVYVIGKNKKLVGVIESAGRDGFLKPISNRKQHSPIHEYMEQSRDMVNKMLKENRPLSPEGESAARFFMAKMVCFEKLLNEKRLGSGSLAQAIGNDDQKFQKAANLICKDPAFEKITDKISLERLNDFVSNHGEIELNRQYIQEVMSRKQGPQAQNIQQVQMAQSEPQMI